MLDRNKTFYALDFDRCLGNTNQLYRLLLTILDERNLTSGKDLDDMRLKVEASGGSFDVMTYLHEKLDAKQLYDLTQAYLAFHSPHPDVFLNQGARHLLDWLDKTKSDFGILTYGGTVWQTLKIKQAGLGQVPHFVLDHPKKSQLLTSWYDEQTGSYHLPAAFHMGRQYQSVVVVDDKAQAFAGLDATPNTRGYWICDVDKTVSEDERNSIPECVRQVRSLDEIIHYEQKILT